MCWFKKEINQPNENKGERIMRVKPGKQNSQTEVGTPCFYENTKMCLTL